MKAMEIFCTSQASTAICLATDQPSPPSSSAPPVTGAGDGRAIDRHNPIITDTKRIITGKTFPNPPCSSQYSPINPQPYHQLHKTKKPGPNLAGVPTDGKNSATHKGLKKKSAKKNSRWSCVKPTDLPTPPGSTRYLLNNKSFRDGSSDQLSPAILPLENDKKVAENQEEFKMTTEISPAPECRSSSPQVVVLRVSLHCRGCEGKVRKHLSKMEGVSSFNIDFGAKKVTINTAGNVTAESVLESVAKVKNAQFWTPPSIQNPNNQQKMVLNI